MIYFSHRGANTRHVQNTVEAFALAHRQGARYFELDVHLLQDGALAVHHDYSLLGTAGKDIRLKDLTAAELRQIALLNPFTQEPAYVPLLQEVLPVIWAELQILNIELKNDGNIYPGLEEAVIAAVPADLRPRVLFSSFDYNCLVRLRKLAPWARIGQLTRAFEVKEALSLQAQSVHINHIRFTAQMAQVCHDNHLKVYCYTVNDKALAERLAAQGVDGIFTDDVTAFIR